MRKVLSFCTLILLLSLNTFAQESTQFLFDQANTLLEEGRYFEALDQYRSIEQKGEVSGALYLNMGITATQIDSNGLAKYYFMKSSGFQTTEDQALEALDYVNSRFSRQSASLPKLPWDKAVDYLKNEVGTSSVFILGFVFILISVSLIFLKWFGVLSLKKHTTLVSTFGALSVLVVVLSFYVDYVEHRYSQAVIINTEIQVKQNPRSDANLVSLAYEGYEITIDNKTSAGNDEWYYIRLGNGQFGWITKTGTKIL